MSVKSKIPRNFSSFLKNGDNKIRLIELIKDYAVEHSQELLLRLKCHEILISLYKICYRLLVSAEADVIECLNSNQKEADTKLLLHAKHMSVIIRSHSGDVDINILFVCMFQDESDRIYLDYGMGKSRKVIKLSDIDMDTDKKTALIGFHAFTRNDYVSSIFRRSKKACWKLLEKNARYIRMFQLFGSTWELPEAMLSQLESFMCALYRRKCREVNVLRYEMFKDTYEKKNKIQDLALLPPCKQTLTLHSRRANYIARVWKLCFRPVIDYDDIHHMDGKRMGKLCGPVKSFQMI